jgi:uncharacterized protein (DUF1501 family)
MKHQWMHCDGEGHHAHEKAALRCTRRQLLTASAVGIASCALGRTAFADFAIRGKKQRTHDNVLVTIFLRGGADGLNIVVPYGDDGYYRNRPTLSIAAPGDKRTSQRALKLDGFFGLHPSLAPLYSLYQNGELGFVHACGSGDGTHSHFEAMATMESGAKSEKEGAGSGWLARHLLSTHNGDSPLRAVALGSLMPDSLRGATSATAIQSLDDFRVQIPAAMNEQSREMRTMLRNFYQNGKDEIAVAGRETLDVLSTLNGLQPSQYKPHGDAKYPETELGSGLRQVAQLIKADVGLEVACLDRGGWDTHVAQGANIGWMAIQLDDLAKSLFAFSRDLSTQWKRVTVLVMTEFGRRLHENSGLGTDHGTASAMMLLGGGVRGGKVFAKWPGLADDQLAPPGDLRVTTDYRDVLAEVLKTRLRNAHLREVFPRFTPQFHGLVT